MSDGQLFADQELGVEDEQQLVKKRKQKGLLIVSLSFELPAQDACSSPATSLGQPAVQHVHVL